MSEATMQLKFSHLQSYFEDTDHETVSLHRPTKNCRCLQKNCLYISFNIQLLKEFKMTKPELECYIRHWNRDETLSKLRYVTFNQWMAWLHNSGKHKVHCVCSTIAPRY